MGYTLDNTKGEYFYCNIRTWPALLLLAYHYGWKPAGTELTETLEGEEVPDWNASYFVNEGQFMTTDDGKALAAALERALDDIPPEGMTDEYTRRLVARARTFGKGIPDAYLRLRVIAAAVVKDPEWIRVLVRFLQHGPCAIC